MCSIIRAVFSDSVENEVYNMFAFITVSGEVAGILGDHQIIKYLIAAQNKQTTTFWYFQQQTLILYWNWQNVETEEK